MLSSITTSTLAPMAAIRTTSNNFPAGVSALKITSYKTACHLPNGVLLFLGALIMPSSAAPA
jgi:hypothetical protein